MKRWKHTMCGKVTEFPAGTNPNARCEICPNCWVALGSWIPA